MTTQGAKTMRHGSAVESDRSRSGDGEQGAPEFRSPAVNGLKRAMDVVLAGAGLLLVSPLLLLLALIIKLSDGGPVVYGHPRSGRNGKIFTCLKLRSMRVDAAERLKDLLASDARARLQWEKYRKLDPDPRVTAVGRFIRKTSLDELPQLFNILRGDMSVIGPRPVTAEETEFYGENAVYYKAVRPGVLGLWQVHGRNKLSYPERIAYDVKYVREWTIWMDVMIILRAIPVVLFGRGAS